MSASQIDPCRLATSTVPVTADALIRFNEIWPQYERTVRHFAAQITSDHDHQQDLIQEAMIALWECNPGRYNILWKPDKYYVRKILINRMWDVWGLRGKGDAGETVEVHAVRCSSPTCDYENPEPLGPYMRAVVSQLQDW